MNYTGSTYRYVFKNLWYIILLSVLPGVVLAAMVRMDYTKEFFTLFFTGRLSECGFAEIFHTFSVYPFTDWLSALFGLFSFLVVVACACMLLALIDKHMRIGKRTLNGIAERLNDNVVSTFFVALLYSVLYELWALVFSAVASLILGKMPEGAAQYVIFCFLLIVFVFALLFLVAVFYLWLPCMQITGFRAFEALRYSNQLEEREKPRLMLSMALSLLLGNACIVPAVLFLPTPAAYVVLTVVYMFFFMFFLTRMEVAYFEDARLVREDENGRYR